MGRFAFLRDESPLFFLGNRIEEILEAVVVVVVLVGETVGRLVVLLFQAVVALLGALPLLFELHFGFEKDSANETIRRAYFYNDTH